jgi:hypothetical protein
MNWAWAASLDQFWRSPNFPMWLILAAAGFFAIIALITLLRAEKSVANSALTVITLLAIGIAVAATLRGFAPGGGGFAEAPSARPTTAALPALSCIDDLAGDTVLAACEKALFGSAESAAAAVSYAASRIDRLTASGDVAAANNAMTGDLQVLRRSVERDRYGLMAYVLVARDRCTPANCAAFQALADRRQIVANMDERVYDGLIARYASSWNAPAAAAPVAAFVPVMPTGKPTTADFPSAASTPAVNIMTPEPGQATPPPAPRAPAAALANAPLPSPRPAATTAPAAPTLAAAKKPPAPKQPRATAPVQLAPTAPAASTASAPDAND